MITTEDISDKASNMALFPNKIKLLQGKIKSLEDKILLLEKERPSLENMTNENTTEGEYETNLRKWEYEMKSSKNEKISLEEKKEVLQGKVKLLKEENPSWPSEDKKQSELFIALWYYTVRDAQIKKYGAAPGSQRRDFYLFLLEGFREMTGATSDMYHKGIEHEGVEDIISKPENIDKSLGQFWKDYLVKLGIMEDIIYLHKLSIFSKVNSTTEVIDIACQYKQLSDWQMKSNTQYFTGLCYVAMKSLLELDPSDSEEKQIKKLCDSLESEIRNQLNQDGSLNDLDLNNKFNDFINECNKLTQSEDSMKTNTGHLWEKFTDLKINTLLINYTKKNENENKLEPLSENRYSFLNQEKPSLHSKKDQNSLQQDFDDLVEGFEDLEEDFEDLEENDLEEHFDDIRIKQ